MLAVKVGLALAVGLCAAGCSKKVSQPQCDAIVDHYAELVVRDAKPDASAEARKADQAREREEARSDDLFRNCTSEIIAADYDCAMAAKSNASRV